MSFDRTIEQDAETKSENFPTNGLAITDTLHSISQGRTSNQYWNKAGVYAFYHPSSGDAIYVGRSKNLCQRLKDHQVSNHNSGSLAFKMARNKYLKNNPQAEIRGRVELQGIWEREAEETGAPNPFEDEITYLKTCKVKVIEIKNSTERALCEVFASIRLKTIDGWNDWTES